jgi:hypothetical protein
VKAHLKDAVLPPHVDAGVFFRVAVETTHRIAPRSIDEGAATGPVSTSEAMAMRQASAQDGCRNLPRGQNSTQGQQPAGKVGDPQSRKGVYWEVIHG